MTKPLTSYRRNREAGFCGVCGTRRAFGIVAVLVSVVLGYRFAIARLFQ